ncbi:hypothetical protein [Roseobacter sp. MH60115]|uniref:hypothetical protein n=1 Tax=Roseobacter sp. MH60115 TaxID=2785324 RepID=UPI0018A24C03|nr:hypothetical protein [Roseobacter sp. MH60115]
MSASEALRGSKEFPPAATQFNTRIDALGWGDLDRVRGPLVFDLTCWDMSVVVDDTFEERIGALWTAMFPNTDRELPPGLTQAELHDVNFHKWRNAWCDVHMLWAHFNAERDVFVTTNTKDFQKNADKLALHGLKAVHTPAEALRILTD